MTAFPWMKFYPGDWRADTALRMCGLAARGLWMEMIAIMHEAEPRGSLLVRGNPVTENQLANLAGATESQTQILLLELEQAGVFSRKKNGIIYSRRIEKDENRARKNRANGKMGGNPILCNDEEKQQSDNPEVKIQKLEARSQKPEARKEAAGNPSDPPEAAAAAGAEIASRASALIGLPEPGRKSLLTVAGWLERGYNPDLDIWPTIVLLTDRARRGGAKPKSLAYFSDAIEENYQARLKTGKSKAQIDTMEYVTVKRGSPQFRAWIEYYKSIGQRVKFSESQESLTVPTEYPPKKEKVA